MDKIKALNIAVEILKNTLASTRVNFVPNDVVANNVADFIETLAERLEKMVSG